MSLTTRAGLLAGAAALTLSGVAFADTTTDANTDDLRAQVEQLQAKLAAMESRQGDNWLTEKRATEIRSLVHDVLADADTRASLLSSGMQAGYDGGFTIGDTTGNFLLRINGQLQVGWIYSNQGDDEIEIPTDEDVFVALGGTLPIDDAGAAALGFIDAADFAAQYAADLAAFNAAVGNLIDDDGMGAAALSAQLGHLSIGNDGDEHRSGFENRRTKLWFTGHVINPNWQYHIEGDFGSMGRFTLLDAYIAHDYGNGFKMVLGQFKLPFLGEQLIDARYLQAVERSLVHSYFTAGRSQGVMMVWEPEGMFRGWASFSDGMNQANTPWNNGPVGGSTEFAFTARAEVLLGGNWDQFHEFRSQPGEEFAARVGGAIHYQDGEYGTTAFMTETEVLGLTADALIKFGGANIFGAVIYRTMDVKTGADSDQWGFVLQGGFHLAPEWEIFARYEYADLDLDDLEILGTSVYSFDDLNVVTFGFNHYLFGQDAGHSAKWTTDFGYAFDRVELTDTRTGWRSDFGGDDGQFVLRSQLQLAF